MSEDSKDMGVDPIAEFEAEFADTPEFADFQRVIARTRAKLIGALWIQKAREHAKLSASELAFKLELSEQEIFDFEDINNCKSEPPSLALMYQIAKVCKMYVRFELLMEPPKGSLERRWSDEAADAMRTILGTKKQK